MSEASYSGNSIDINRNNNGILNNGLINIVITNLTIVE